MNVIVSNKQKSVLDNANIDAIKDLNGLFNVDELINNFKGYFFSKIIIDATSIIDFAKEEVIKKLSSGIGSEKIILLLPEKPDPPKKFCDFLESLGINNYSTKISDVINFVKGTDNNSLNSSFNNDENIYQQNEESNDINGLGSNVNQSQNVKEENEIYYDSGHNNKIVLGFKNVTEHAGSTSLIYMIKQCIEKKSKKTVDCVEVGSDNFKYFNSKNMYSIDMNNFENTVVNSKSDIILVDLNNNSANGICSDTIYLIEPSILKVNKLVFENREIFTILHNKKVILNKSMLTQDEVLVFGKEAGIGIFYNIPYVNDRNDNKIIETFVNKLGILDKGGQGIFGMLNNEK